PFGHERHHQNLAVPNRVDERACGRPERRDLGIAEHGDPHGAAEQADEDGPERGERARDEAIPPGDGHGPAPAAWSTDRAARSPTPGGPHRPWSSAKAARCAASADGSESSRSASRARRGPVT